MLSNYRKCDWLSLLYYMYIREGRNLHGLHKSNLLMLTLNDFSFLPAGQQVFFFLLFTRENGIEGGGGIEKVRELVEKAASE